MKPFAKLLALTCLAIAPACALQAQTGTMTCTGTSSLTIPITSVYFALTTSLTTSYFTVTAPIAEANLLESSFFFNNSFDSCSFTPTNGTVFGTVQLSSVTGYVDGGQQYASATFSYSVIVMGSAGDKVTMTPPAIPMTEADKRKALADYLVTVPRPSSAATNNK